MGNLDLYDENNPNDLNDLTNQLAKESATTPEVASDGSFMDTLKDLIKTPTNTQPGFDDIYNGFKEGGVAGGVKSLANYLNSPDGQEIVGGLISKQNPYAGKFMVDNAEQKKNIALQNNMPLSKSQLAPILAELYKTEQETGAKKGALGFDFEKFLVENGMKSKEFKETQNKNLNEKQLAEQRLALEAQTKQDAQFEDSIKGLRPDDAALARNLHQNGKNWQDYYDVQTGLGGVGGSWLTPKKQVKNKGWTIEPIPNQG